MATHLSEDEFHRLQSQLLELRTKNYSLEEKGYKYQNELSQLYQHMEDLKKELSKAQKTISRSKSARDVDQLLQENDTLQRKLQSQEDEFRLQNETLMQELSSLVVSNEKLEKELELSRSHSSPSTDLEVQIEITRLQAENAALRKSLANAKTLQEAKIPFDEDVLSSHEVKNGEVQDSNYISEEQEGYLQENRDLKLKLDIEYEEKKILKEQLQKLERSLRKDIINLQGENDKLSEKLKKKQESLLQLQEEKECMYSENKKAYENLQGTKSNEIQQLKEQIQNMQIQLNLAIQSQEQKQNSASQKLGDSLSKLESHINYEPEATVEFIAGERASFECSLNETKLSLIRCQEEIKLLGSQLKESEDLIKKLEQEKIVSEKEKNSWEIVALEANKLAENRKSLLDEMANHLQETSAKHSEEVEDLKQQFARELNLLQAELDKEKEAGVELEKSKSKIQKLEKEVETLKHQLLSIQRELKEAKDMLEKAKASFHSQLEKCKEEHVIAITQLEEQLQMQLQDFTIQIEVARAEKAEFEEKVTKLNQEAKDSVYERKIHEKKGLSMVKELKRQLQMERKRAEKLQERLQEVLNEQNRSVDEILQSTNQADKPKGDASSVSSWSYVSGGTTDKENREGVIHSDGSSGGQDSPSRVSPTMLEMETNNLLAKVAYLQQKSWSLEEKVNHLEMSNAAMVDDLMKKTAIIQYYCMEGRSDPHSSVVQDKLTIKRIVDFIKDKGDENLREINRRMQRMLEETLTKNMHLQKDIETLSNEVSRLTKMVQVSVDPELQSTVFLHGV